MQRKQEIKAWEEDESMRSTDQNNVQSKMEELQYVLSLITKFEKIIYIFNLACYRLWHM